MDYYFISNYSYHSPANRKCAEMQEYAKQWEHTLLNGQIALDAFWREIQNKASELDDKYPRTKKLAFSNDIDNRVIRCLLKHDGCNSDLDKTVFNLTINKVKRLYHFSENNQLIP
ncbi:MAG: hypothetical protein LBV74_01260 [Tannerella sp.]|jgi:hypothetical protein|nr:hypothetical protein [Tannerella sp.]